MTDYLTARQVQEILKVDRITVYRMLQDGRLKGTKIGQQWRFARAEIEQLLGAATTATEGNGTGDMIFPVHCIQTIQDLFAQIGEISALVLDEDGLPVTQLSKPRLLYELVSKTPYGRTQYATAWRDFVAQSKQGNRFFVCPAGLHYLGAPIQDKDKTVGLFLAGQVYFAPPDASERQARLQRLAGESGLSLDVLRQAAEQVPLADPEFRQRIEAWPSTAARTIESILRERVGFVERLQQIATLTQIS